MTELQKELMHAIEAGATQRVISAIDSLTEGRTKSEGLCFRDEDGNTPLHIAAQYGGDFEWNASGMREPIIFRELLKATPQLIDMQVACGQLDDFKWTALHVAAIYRRIEIIDYLIYRKANPKILDSHGYEFTEWLPEDMLNQIQKNYEKSYERPLLVPHNRRSDMAEHIFNTTVMPMIREVLPFQPVPAIDDEHAFPPLNPTSRESENAMTPQGHRLPSVSGEWRVIPSDEGNANGGRPHLSVVTERIANELAEMGINRNDFEAYALENTQEIRNLYAELLERYERSLHRINFALDAWADETIQGLRNQMRSDILQFVENDLRNDLRDQFGGNSSFEMRNDLRVILDNAEIREDLVNYLTHRMHNELRDHVRSMLNSPLQPSSQDFRAPMASVQSAMPDPAQSQEETDFELSSSHLDANVPSLAEPRSDLGFPVSEDTAGRIQQVSDSWEQRLEASSVRSQPRGSIHHPRAASSQHREFQSSMRRQAHRPNRSLLWSDFNDFDAHRDIGVPALPQDGQWIEGLSISQDRRWQVLQRRGRSNRRERNQGLER